MLKLNNIRIRVGRLIYFTLAIIFMLCTLAQIYLAGMAIFQNPAVWGKHMMFVHFFGFNIPFLMLIFAFVGSMPRWAYWQIFGVLFSIFLMYFTTNITSALPWLGSMHPVIAIPFVILSGSMVLKTWKLIIKKTLFS